MRVTVLKKKAEISGEDKAPVKLGSQERMKQARAVGRASWSREQMEEKAVWGVGVLESRIMGREGDGRPAKKGSEQVSV